jgi:hypothetical protein
MSRQDALNQIWKRLFAVLFLSLAACIGVLFLGEDARVGTLVFLIGNIGGYVSVHRGLGELNDAEVIGLSRSWWSIIVPSFVGGVLALVMYLLFLSNIISGDIFPLFKPDTDSPNGVESILTQHANGMNSYAKLFVWSFISGFNQKYVVDIINSVKTKS